MRKIVFLLVNFLVIFSFVQLGATQVLATGNPTCTTSANNYCTTAPFNASFLCDEAGTGRTFYCCAGNSFYFAPNNQCVSSCPTDYQPDNTGHQCITTAQTQPPAGTTAGINPDNLLTQQTLNALNPIQLYSTNISDFATPGTLISRVLLFAFPIAGIILFVMLIWAGFEILSGASDKKSLDNGKNRASAAIIGFILLFTSYMIMRVIEVIFGIKVLM